MIKNYLNKFKNYFNNPETDNKKKIENLVVFIIILIIIIIAINIIWKDDKKEEISGGAYKQLAINNMINESNINESNLQDDALSERLEEILSKISGVGNVNVLITYSESSQVIAMYNENSKQSITEETDTSGRKQKNRRNRHYKRYNI